MIGLLVLKIFLCKYKEKEEKDEHDNEDDGGPIYYDNNEQLERIQIQRAKITSIEI
jgi:hypothetical protein